MKKKKNNKMKMTIAAGLLITPAIVAQAGTVQASEVTADSILTIFQAFNENSDVTTITQLETLFTGLKSEEKKLIDDANYTAIIQAKFDYVKAYAAYKNDAKAVVTAINKLTTTNKSIVADAASAQDLLDKLNIKLEANETALENAFTASSQPIDFLGTLNYYGQQGNFIKENVGETKQEQLKTFNGYATEISSFEIDFIAPIKVVSKEKEIVKENYETAVQDARIAFDTLDEIKEILKIQLVDGVSIEQFIKNEEANVTKAETFEKKVEDFIANVPTGSTFNSKIATITKDYEALTPLQKALVENYSKMSTYTTALAMMDKITALTKLSAKEEPFRTELEKVDGEYENLSVAIKQNVQNSAKLTELNDLVKKAQDVETLISSLKTENLSVELPKAQAAYKGLTTTDKKYVYKDFEDVLKSWESSSSTASKVEKQINDIPLDGLNTLDDKALTDAKKVSAITNFLSKARVAQAGYAAVVAADEKNNTQQALLISNRTRLEGLLPLIDPTNQIISLKSTSKTYADDLTAAKTALDGWNAAGVLADDQAKIEKLKVYLTDHLKALEDEKKAAEKIEQDIIALKEAKPISLSALTATKDAYNALSTNGKGLVRNFADLKALETQYKEALNVVKLISELDTEARDFAKKTVSTQTAYEKLTLASKEVVDNKKKLDELLPFAQVMNDIDAIRATAKDFKAQLEAATTKYKTLAKTDPVKPEDPKKDYVAAATYRLVVEYEPKLAAHQGTVDRAKAMEDKIEALKSKSGETFMNDLKAISDEYKKLDSTIKRNIGNAKTLTDLERDYKATLKVIDQIDKLPSNTEKTFASKVAAAQKAYERLTEKQRNDVFNYSTKLKPVLKAAELINRIDKLRIGSKTYQQEVAAIRAEYSALSTTEKGLVYNITKLEDAETSMSKAEEIIKLIDLAIPTAEEYIKKLIAARDAYDALPKTEQKLVTNYKDLQTRERAVKPVLKLDNDILALDPSNAKTFISKYKSAQKAYEKLKMADRGLLINLDLLTGEKTSLYNVINAISSIKNSSKTFVEDTKNARSLYDALSADLKAKVSNYAILQGHELNVEGGKTVDAMIQALNSSEPTEFIANVKAARAAYKALSSANKKAVTLEAELKAQEKYIKPVETAIKAIDDLSNPSKDLSRQFTTVNKALQKLDNKQMTYVSNIDKYSNLSNVIHAYTMIAGLKSSDKYYQGNIEAARTAYDKLSEEEKMKVTNYYKLQEALLDMSEVQKVTSIISSLNPSTSSYFADVEKAQAAYKELPSGSRKQVLNYSVLKDAEKDVKTAQKVVKQIDDLDPSIRTYESKAKSAKKAYDKLNETQKQLIYNYNKLQAAIFELGL